MFEHKYTCLNGPCLVLVQVLDEHFGIGCCLFNICYSIDLFYFEFVLYLYSVYFVKFGNIALE